MKNLILVTLALLAVSTSSFASDSVETQTNSDQDSIQYWLLSSNS
jgi:hypothetical protein